MRKKTILHLFHDDKFFDDAFDLFDQLIGYTNIYLIYNSTGSFQYLRNIDRLTIIRSKKEYKNYIKSCNVDFAFIHSMYGNTMKSVLSFSPSVKIIWASMGYDLYGSKSSLPPININLHMPLTNSYFKQQKSVKKEIKKTLRLLIGEGIIQKKAIHRIDFCSTICDSEFKLLQRLPYFKAKPFYWHYPFKDSFFDSKMNHINASSISIGNSASFTNNHLDIFKILSENNIKGREIVLPMSYGEEQCKKTVIDHLHMLEGNKVIVLTDFLPFDEYMSIQDSCGYAIFGHIRQQALGNIIIMLFTGVKVFINQDSIMYDDLKKLGLIFKSLQSENLKQELSQPLSKEERAQNRNIIATLYNNKTKIELMQQCFDANS